MIEIDIPTIDPIQHTPKVFLGLTARQIVCVIPSAAAGIAVFFALRKLNLDMATILACLCVAPGVCLGWLRPYNMKFEDFVKLWWFNSFVSEPKRIYKTDNAVNTKMLTIKERQELEKREQAKALAEKKKNKQVKNKPNKGKELS